MGGELLVLVRVFQAGGGLTLWQTQNAHRLPRTRKQPQPHSDRQKRLQAAQMAKRDILFVRGLFRAAGSNWGGRVPARR